MAVLTRQHKRPAIPAVQRTILATILGDRSKWPATNPMALAVNCFAEIKEGIRLIKIEFLTD